MTTHTSANPLSTCVSSLRSTTALLSSSIAVLDSGIHDYPRLTKVLQTTRHFELLPERSLQAAQASLLSSLTPEVASLLQRVETHLDKLQRREQALAARTELLEGRIGEERRASIGGAAASSRQGDVSAQRRPKAKAVQAGFSRDELRLKQLVRKKESLAYAVEGLNLQAKQRQRDLRRSVVALKEGDGDEGEF